ncbi:hypothetical protein H3C65_01950 [Patescibacteria group bacterium]|nr:hypothetical protein [Patescibacteria group bacterium]
MLEEARFAGPNRFKGLTYFTNILDSLPLSDSGIEGFFEKWRARGYPNSDTLLGILGHTTEDVLGPYKGYEPDRPFEFWLGARISYILIRFWQRNSDFDPAQERIVRELSGSEQENFEGQVATFLCGWFLKRIGSVEVETYNNDNQIDVLAGLITALQLISTNLINSPSYVIKYLREKYGTDRLTDMYSYINNFILMDCFNSLGLTFDRDHARAIKNNFWQLYLNHYKAYKDGYESSVRFPKNLMVAFFRILRDIYKYTNIPQEFYFAHKPNESDNIKADGAGGEVKSEDERSTRLKAQFVYRYVQGLFEVTKKMEEGSSNGVLYLYDHLKMIIEKNGLLPKKPLTEVTLDEWERVLLDCLKDESLFQFHLIENKVREPIGRYDYRALLKYFLFMGYKELKTISLGFGKIGAPTWEMSEQFKEKGIGLDVYGVDLNQLNDNIPPDNVVIQRFMRTKDGVLRDADKDRLPDVNTLPKDEVRVVMRWRSQLIKNGRLFGGVDLVKTSPDLPLADLVTLQGTVACFGNYMDRVALIKNALNLVNPNGGVLLIEGGMTLTGGQNINSIALRLDNGKVEILYVEVNRSRGVSVPSSYVANNKTLLVNSDVIPGFEATNCECISFSDDKELFNSLFNSIRKMSSV